MHSPLFNMFNLSILIMSSICSIYMNNLFIMWILMEISSMTFSILLNYNSKKISSILFFLISNLTSIFIIMTFILMKTFNFEMNSLLIFGLWLKLGMFPLNYWMNLMMKNMTYSLMIPLLIYTKFIPLMMFILFVSLNKILYLMLLLSMFMPSLLAMNTTSFFLLLNYSSMFHMSLIAMISLINPYSSLLYFLFYALSTYLILNFLNKNKIYSKNSMNFFMTPNTKKIYSILMFFYSQLPPFTTFALKWIMIESFSNNMPLFSLTTMMTTIIMTFNYLNFTNYTFFNYSIKFNFKMKLISPPLINFSLYPLIFISFFMIYLFNFLFI